MTSKSEGLYTLWLCTDMWSHLCSKKQEWHHLPDDSHNNKQLPQQQHPPSMFAHLSPKHCQRTNTKQAAQMTLVRRLGPRVRFFLSLLTNKLIKYLFFIIRFLSFDYNVAHSSKRHTQAPCCCCELLLTGWQWVCFWTTTTATLHRCCEPLLAGRKWVPFLDNDKVTTAANHDDVAPPTTTAGN
jgi:hypothetical protein